MKFMLFCLSIIAAFFTGGHPVLTVKVTNIETPTGEIVIGVFNTDKGFLEDGAAIKSYSIPVDAVSESITIDDLPKGNYAISLFHDANSDGECNLNFFGIPKEGYGFSKNFVPKLSAPDFEDCMFSLSEDAVLDVRLIH